LPEPRHLPFDPCTKGNNAPFEDQDQMSNIEFSLTVLSASLMILVAIGKFKGWL
jgi:hypothetical protein